MRKTWFMPMILGERWLVVLTDEIQNAGECEPSKRTIRILSTMSRTDKRRTLAHEFVHAMLAHSDLWPAEDVALALEIPLLSLIRALGGSIPREY